MHRVEPNLHLVAHTSIDDEGLKAYLEEIGAPDWATDAPSDVEEIVEVMGRECYRAFGVDLNENITRVREGNAPYLLNILSSGHGSVLQHSWVSFMFTNVSRVLTHELVRHTAGTAVSQESLRYVRLNNLGLWIPSCFADNPKAVEVFERAWRQAEENYMELLSYEVLGEDIDQDVFGRKKELTSAARRVSPIGLATSIGWSCNIRALRNVIEQRTSRYAEEEVRLLFNKVADLVIEVYPNLFGDYNQESINGYTEFTTPYRKV